MALWCRDLPVVTVPRGETAKPVTLVLPYYENPAFLQRQYEGWGKYPSDLRSALAVIIVDDGSPDMHAKGITQGWENVAGIRQFRIEVDRRWNWLAARNIGAHHAADGWLLLTDMDHVVPEETLRAVIFGQHDSGVVYAFSRREHTGEAIAPHSASFLMTRAMFWKIGGYDETFSGRYGTDGLYRRRVAATAPMQVLTDELVRYEYVCDSSTTRYGRKEPQDAGLQALVASLPKGHKPKVLSFKYHEVTL